MVIIEPGQVSLEPGQRWDVLTSPPAPGYDHGAYLYSLAASYAALVRYLNLSPQEQGFVRALGEAPRERDVFLVLADYLKERGREEAATAVLQVNCAWEDNPDVARSVVVRQWLAAARAGHTTYGHAVVRALEDVCAQNARLHQALVDAEIRTPRDLIVPGQAVS